MSGQLLQLVRRLGSEHFTILVLWLGAFVVRVFAASIGTPVEGRIGTYTAGWNLRIKAIRAIGRRRKGASGAVPLASI